MTSLFQDELNYLREVGKEFAKLNPKLSKYLSESSSDPDVERLLEGFAFLTSKVREKIEDELPELTHSIMELLWPNFLRPFPATAMVKFIPNDRAITERKVIAAGSSLRSRPIEGVACQFRTTSDCIVYPLNLAEPRMERTRDRARLSLTFTTLSGQPACEIGLDTLRLTFTGESAVAQMLYLWTRRYMRSARILPAGKGNGPNLAHENFAPGGFGPEEAILPHSVLAFDGHRLLQEFFAFPEKFYCVDVHGLQAALRGVNESEFTLEIEYERPLPVDVKLRPDNIQLYCVPAVNLFACDADPFINRHEKSSYRVRPRGPRQDEPSSFADTRSPVSEIFSIDRVSSEQRGLVREGRSRQHVYPRFESFEHEIEQAERRKQLYFRQRITPLLRGGYQYEISFVRHDGSKALAPEEAVSIDLTCFNGSVASELAVGDILFGLQDVPSFVGITNISRPTPVIYPPLDGSLNWAMISNMSLNYMSLLDRKALAAILAVYDHRALNDRQAQRAGQRRLDGIVDLETKPYDRLFKGLPIRGLRSRMVLREANFQTEGEMYLFGSVLSEFFSLYSTVNSFHELEVRGEQRGEVYRWPAKIGRQPLI